MVCCACNGKEVAHVSWADASDVDETVKLAHAAWPASKSLPQSERAGCLRKIGNVLRELVENTPSFPFLTLIIPETP